MERAAWRGEEVALHCRGLEGSSREGTDCERADECGCQQPESAMKPHAPPLMIVFHRLVEVHRIEGSRSSACVFVLWRRLNFEVCDQSRGRRKRGPLWAVTLGLPVPLLALPLKGPGPHPGISSCIRALPQAQAQSTAMVLACASH